MRPVFDAFGAAVGTAPAVACVCPTIGRHELHPEFYKTFAAQDYPAKRLYVLDEGAHPSKFFGALSDPRVRYVHAPSPRGEVTRIGTARNKIMAMVGEPLVAHVDDDDVYAPAYLSTMIGRLLSERGDVAKLSVFNNLHGDDVYQWDVRQMGGLHYAIKGGEPAARVDVPQPDPTLADAMMLGYGFSYVFQRSAWERVKFPAEGTEDYPWIKQLQTLGAKIVHVADYPEGVLHTVHEKSASVLFPQKHLGARRALGLGAAPSGMQELPEGKDLQLQPGVRYAVLASVKKSNSLKDIAARCATWGLAIESMQDNVAASDYGVAAPAGDYRLIYAVGTARKAMRMPWKVPSPASWFNASCCLRAWSSAPKLSGVVRSTAMYRSPFAAIGAGVAAAPPNAIPYRQVTPPVQLQAGLRYRVGFQQTFDYDPGNPVSYRALSEIKYALESFFTIESLDPQQPAQLVPGLNTYQQPWVMQGIASSNATFDNTPNMTLLVVGVQSSGTPGAVVPIQPATNPAPTDNVSGGKVLIVSAGLGVGAGLGWYLYRLSSRRTRRRAA
jgi:hypothetical protein